MIFGEKQMWRHLTMLPSTSGLPDPSDLHSDSTVTDWHYNLYLQGEGEPECCSHIDDTWICTEKEEDIVKWALKNNISEKVPTQLGMRLLYLKKLLRSTFVHSCYYGDNLLIMSITKSVLIQTEQVFQFPNWKVSFYIFLFVYHAAA